VREVLGIGVGDVRSQEGGAVVALWTVEEISASTTALNICSLATLTRDSNFLDLSNNRVSLHLVEHYHIP
jgi:hypothetical protein